MKKNHHKFIVPTVYVTVVATLIVGVYLIISGINNFINDNIYYKYTLDNVFDNTVPVMGETEGNKNVSIIRPYISESIKIGRYFYDFEADVEGQESSIVYYENTYMQNSGVDYVSDEAFDVVSVLDGEVLSVEENDVYGNIVTIKHNDNLITVYSSLTDVLVNKGYKVAQGEIIAMSSQSILNDNKSTLHFEVYYKNEVIDPENLYSLTLDNIR